MQAVAPDAPGSMTETSERGLVGGQGGGHPRLRQRPAAALGHEVGEGADAGVTAASSGDAAGMASRLARPVSVIRPGLVMIQPVTARTFGGTGTAAFPRKRARDGTGTAAFPRKRAREPRTCR